MGSSAKRTPNGEMQKRMRELVGHLRSHRVREARQTRRHLNNMRVSDRMLYESLPQDVRAEFADLYPAAAERLGVGKSE